MNLENLLDRVNDLILTKVSNMRKFTADEVGLDYRCGSVWVDAECVITLKGNDRSLQYYGGFEYVDNQYDRTEFGQYVVYSTEEDERILDVIRMAEGL